MKEIVLKDFGFIALDLPSQCSISGGESDSGVIGAVLEGLLNALAKKMGNAGIIATMLANNVDSFIEGFKAGWNK